MSDYFKDALRDFASDMASGDAIRHLADTGMTIGQIADNLTYPAKTDYIRQTVWKHYLNNGTILTDEPAAGSGVPLKVDYVLEHDSYGRASYRRVETAVSEKSAEYVPCDFGRKLYNDRDNFMNALSCLDKDDKEYILSLPWPLKTVYHIRNERMSRIMGKLKQFGEQTGRI